MDVPDIEASISARAAKVDANPRSMPVHAYLVVTTGSARSQHRPQASGEYGS
jgi:hypothetical protein